MPYVEKQYRKKLDPTIEHLIEQIDAVPDIELKAALTTYVFYKMVRRIFGKLNWSWRSKIYSILFSVLTEFQRFCMEPYEDEKKHENGDVV